MDRQPPFAQAAGAQHGGDAAEEMSGAAVAAHRALQAAQSEQGPPAFA